MVLGQDQNLDEPRTPFALLPSSACKPGGFALDSRSYEILMNMHFTWGHRIGGRAHLPRRSRSLVEPKSPSPKRGAFGVVPRGRGRLWLLRSESVLLFGTLGRRLCRHPLRKTTSANVTADGKHADWTLHTGLVFLDFP